MSRSEEAAKHLLDGLIPSRIARRMRISFESVEPYLRREVGNGRIRFSDILFVYNDVQRAAFDEAIKRDVDPSDAELQRLGVTTNDYYLYDELKSNGVTFGDLYEYLRHIEVSIHQEVRKLLVAKYGEGEKKWWCEGVPEDLRVKCQSMRERDSARAAHAFQYVTLGELGQVASKHWRDRVKDLPIACGATNGEEFKRILVRLCDIRNLVMHPLKGIDPTVDDFIFVRDIHRRLFPDQESNDGE